MRLCLGLLLFMLAVAGLTWLVRAQPAPAASTPARAMTVSGGTTIADVLTGRPRDDSGFPVAPESGPGSPDQPLRMRFVPSAERTEALATIDSLLNWLRKRTGYAIEGEILQSYGLVVQELVEGQCDVAFLTAVSYARAYYATEFNDTPEDDIEAFLAVARQGMDEVAGSDCAYRSAFLVRSDSPMQSIEDITADTRIAMGSPTSGASSLLPSALLNARQLKPRITRFGGGYPLIIEAVLQSSVDVGCIWWSPPTGDSPQHDARVSVKRSHPDIFESTRIIGFTDWIPNEPVVARKALPKAMRHTLARALTLYIAGRNVTEAGRRELQAVGSLMGYIPATNDDFKPLLDVVERAFANDAEGLKDFKRVVRK